VVQTPGGTRYTRNGAFQFNAQGTLVTSEGYAVQSTGGPIQLAPTETGFTIARDGTISTSEGQRGRISVVQFPNRQSLAKDGASTFRTDVAGATAPVSVALIQGAVEKSNVKPIREMSRMVEVTRSYTNLASLLDKQDEIRRTAIERLADVPA
jgi:flagellar basal-body rod protein FlgF